MHSNIVAVFNHLGSYETKVLPAQYKLLILTVTRGERKRQRAW